MSSNEYATKKSEAKGIKGWAGGIPTDFQDTLCFAEMTGVRGPMIDL